MNSNVYSWKNKIDPSFDEIIKSYLEFINHVGLPSNSGWIILEDRFLSRWEKEGMKSWADIYEKKIKKMSKTIFQFKKPKKMSEKEKTTLKRNFKKQLFRDINVLPQASQDYYRKAFEPFYTEKYINADFTKMTKDKLKEVFTDLYVNQVVLGLHALMIRMKEEAEKASEDILMKKYFKTTIAFEVLSSLYDSISCLVFEKPFTTMSL